jgi:hypothetical protein
MAEIIPFRPRGEPGRMRYRRLWLQRLDRLRLDLDGMAGSGMEMVPPRDELLAERKAPGK